MSDLKYPFSSKKSDHYITKLVSGEAMIDSRFVFDSVKEAEGYLEDIYG